MKHTIEYTEKEIKTGYAFDTYFGNLKAGILDIETTGLSPERARVILGGLITVSDDSDKLKCEEFFCEYNNDRDEKELLRQYMAAIKTLDVVISYNGDHFDLPFLKYRCEKLGLEYEGDLPHSLDLYRVIRSYSEIKKVLPNLKQKTVENYAGLWPTRTDEISGKDSIDLYYAYLSHKEGEGKEAVKRTIILHNSDDCMQLYRLIPILAKTDMHRAMYSMGFPVGRLSVESIEYRDAMLTVRGTQRKAAVNYSSYPTVDSSMRIEFASEGGRFFIKIPVQTAGGTEGIPRLWLIDSESLGFGVDMDKISVLPGVEKGFIIIKKGNEVNYLVINEFIKALLFAIEAHIGQNREG